MIESNSSGSTKNSSWLNNSTFKPVKIIEYSDEEAKKEIDYNFALDSDSSYEKPKHKKHKEKKKRYKIIKKKDVIKHYLKQIPTISDEKCKYNRKIFAEELPRDERNAAFFVDQRGNPYIYKFGSICESHIPKYKLKKYATLSNVLSDRYYNVLKKSKVECNEIAVTRKNCDSHCICQQSFIPIPYDIISKSQKHNDQALFDEISNINESLNKDPHNINSWLNLVDIQNKANEIGTSTTIVTSIIQEKKLMIVERALKKNQGNLQLYLLRLKLGGELWPLDKLQKEWNQLLFVWNANINVWKFYIDQISKKSLGFSVEKVIAIYTKCFSFFFNIMSGRMKTKTIDSVTVMEVCDLFSEFCDYLTQSGFKERATASWQVVIEYNFFCGALRPRQTGNILDDPMLKSLNQFWSSNAQHFGQPDSRGWITSHIPDINKCPLQTHLQETMNDIESRLLASDIDETQMWVQLEDARQQVWWIPCTNAEEDEEDLDRVVSFPSLQASLVTLHTPCNLPETESSVDVSRQAKIRLILLFFDYLGVFHPHVSIKQCMSSTKIRNHQIKFLQPLHKYEYSPKMFLPPFIKGCFNQLKGIYHGDPFVEDMYRLELSHEIHGILEMSGWKEVLTCIRQTAKRILSTHSGVTILWIDYDEILLGLIDHTLFKESDKAMKALLNEATKVTQALYQQISSDIPLEYKLNILELSIHLAMKENSSSPDTVSRTVTLLYQGTCLFSHKYSLNPPHPTLSSLYMSQTEVITMMEQGDSPENHWHYILYFHAISKLLLVNVEPFNSWMMSDCLRIIKDLGSMYDWYMTFLYQLSHFLEMLTSFFAMHVHSRGLNESALLRSLLAPFIKTLTEVQNSNKYTIVDIVLSPKLIQICIGQKYLETGQKLSVRNFLWNIVGSSEKDDIVTFNYTSHGTSLMLLNMELERWHSLAVMNDESDLFTGRSDRVRSTFNRLLSLRCMYWRYRLTLWLSMMKFEAKEINSKSEERVKGVFYRAVTEMPAQKSLYMTVVSLVPSLLEEITILMKNNGLRLCTPLEEVKLLLRIKNSSKFKEDEETTTHPL